MRHESIQTIGHVRVCGGAVRGTGGPTRQNAQRPIAVGRKNHLFLGSESGGLVAATCYSLIQSCRLQLIDPVGYLIQVSARLLAGETDYDALTPWAIAEGQRRAAADRTIT